MFSQVSVHPRGGGGRVPQSLISGPFLGGGGELPSLWSKVPSVGGGTPWTGEGYPRQDKGTPQTE